MSICETVHYSALHSSALSLQLQCRRVMVITVSMKGSMSMRKCVYTKVGTVQYKKKFLQIFVNFKNMKN